MVPWVSIDGGRRVRIRFPLSSVLLPLVGGSPGDIVCLGGSTLLLRPVACHVAFQEIKPEMKKR